jgi:ABC-type branched-subunit amino acid transport system substrate-binding protein
VRRAVCLLAALAALTGCGSEDEDLELLPGSVARIGIATGSERRDALVPNGVQVAATSINSAGGIGGAAAIQLVVGPVERLLSRGIRLLVLPCDAAAARAGALAASRGGAVAMAPCDDGALPRARTVFATGLSPARQAEVLAEHVDGRATLLQARSERGRRVHVELRELLVGPGTELVSPEAPERVLPAAHSDGTLYATYGFPEPGSETDEFYERYRALFDRRPVSIVAALAADALTALANAIEEAGTTDPGRVADVIRQDGIEISGVLGKLEFRGGSSRAKVTAVVLRVERGRYQVVGRTD